MSTKFDELYILFSKLKDHKSINGRIKFEVLIYGAILCSDDDDIFQNLNTNVLCNIQIRNLMAISNLEFEINILWIVYTGDFEFSNGQNNFMKCLRILNSF